MPEVQWETDQLKVDRIALGLVCPTAALTLAECIYHSLHLGVFVPHGMLYMLNTGFPLLFVLLGGLTVALSARHGREGMVLGAAGLTVAFFVAHSYRGSMFWPGILDRVYESRAQTLLAFSGALIVGFATPWMLPKRWRASVMWIWLGSAILGLALAYSWVDANRPLHLYAELPYSRHYALTVISAAVAVWALITYRWGRT